MAVQIACKNSEKIVGTYLGTTMIAKLEWASKSTNVGMWQLKLRESVGRHELLLFGLSERRSISRSLGMER